MNFIKKIFGKEESKHTLPEYIKDYKVYGNLFRREEKVSKLIMEDALISFSEGKTEFSFFLEFFKDEQPFYFPIAPSMDLREQTAHDGDKVIRKYVFDLESKLRMRVEFDVTEEKDLEVVLQFERYFSELLSIVTFQKPISEISNERIQQMCRHIVGKDLGRESETTSQKDSDVFSIAQHQIPNQTSIANQDMNRLSKELAGLNLDDGSKRVGEYQHQFQLYKKSSSSKENQVQDEKKSQYKIREDLIIQNENNAKLKDALLEIANKKEIKVANVGSLYEASGVFMQLKHKGIIFSIKLLEDYDYKLLIYNEDQHVIHQYHFEQSYEINHQENYIRWIENKADSIILYQVFFDSPGASQQVAVALQSCNYEKNNKVEQQKAFKDEEIQQIIRFSSERSDENYIEENKDYMDEEINNITFDPQVYIAQGETQSNSDLRSIAQAKILDRTFVSKGENIEVYRTIQDQDQDLEYLLTLPIVQGLNGEVFEPKKILMQEQDTKMLLLNNEENKKVYYYDIEKGKIIQEFGADEGFNNAIKDFCNQTKNGDLENTKTFYSINSKNIFRMDPRISKGAAQTCIQNGSKMYAQNNHFTCISSTKNGEFAIGSADGSVRLYNDVTKNAKNQFNLGYGDPIKGLDISQDGKWILATCQTYLILFPTYDCSNVTKNGFNSTIKIDNRPVPIRLQLSSEDQYYLKLKEIGFTPAKFDNCLTKKEKFIVSTTGAFTIVWDFIKVLQKKTQCYEIKKSDEPIQQAEFKFNKNDNVLAASVNRVEMQNIIKNKK
ncbi:Vid27 cytoplasmic protein (macronuclear) [Tetrahymena thermophila SB210]|uniref:Vid27 cytoplasmic protein n=1 Tax=Tetrahymena thermophila (strain SB210) TaxID=312017 RepID=Q23H43_TETTS|nr:Vid27 cytoplasmic protein [Tetrahymena thermophila SB210]EAR95804.2 Vid27 cytoplasmic protein [Tetrahymena thermophila SB210]|eukprot:XP_001016049.2 Vid27 cytoplasmic protein [Tetrahymena thermophila SB210]